MPMRDECTGKKITRRVYALSGIDPGNVLLVLYRFIVKEADFTYICLKVVLTLKKISNPTI